MNACHAAGEARLMCLEDAKGDVNTASVGCSAWDPLPITAGL